MDYLDIFQYCFMGIVCIGGIIFAIKVILEDKK